MTHRILTLSIMTLIIMTVSIMTHSIMTLSIMTLGITTKKPPRFCWMTVYWVLLWWVFLCWISWRPYCAVQCSARRRQELLGRCLSEIMINYYKQISLVILHSDLLKSGKRQVLQKYKQLYDIQPNGHQHNVIRHNDTQHDDIP